MTEKVWVFLVKVASLPLFGGPDVLEVADAPVPSVGPNDVLIRVAAAGINSAPDPFGAARPKAVALSIAIVVVVLTLSGRDVPSAA